jgi:hypothetical protein
MTTMESAVRELLDALLLLQPGLQAIDEGRSIDENMQLTGVGERYVKAYLLGLRALH